MPYVERDKDGAIVGVYEHRQPSRAEEAVRGDDVEVAAFQDRARAVLDGRIPDNRPKGDRLERLLAREGLSVDDLKAELAKPTAARG